MKTFAWTLVFFLLIAGHTQTLWGQTFYKCETAEGVTFSSQPCSVDAEKIRTHEQSGGVDTLEADEVVESFSDAPAHEGPILKTLGGQVRDSRRLENQIIQAKSPQVLCGYWTDLDIYIPCND